MKKIFIIITICLITNNVFSADVYYVGSSAVVSAGASTFVEITPHASTIAGDLLIVQLYQENAPNMATCPGWTLLNYSGTKTQYFSHAFTYADNSSSYFFSSGMSELNWHIVGVIHTFRNAKSPQPLEYNVWDPFEATNKFTTYPACRTNENALTYGDALAVYLYTSDGFENKLMQFPFGFDFLWEGEGEYTGTFLMATRVLKTTYETMSQGQGMYMNMQYRISQTIVITPSGGNDQLKVNDVLSWNKLNYKLSSEVSSINKISNQ